MLNSLHLTVSSLSRHLSGQNILPAMLKMHSTGADEAGMQRYVRVTQASLFNWKYF